jgi:hypothetical protein
MRFKSCFHSSSFYSNRQTIPLLQIEVTLNLNRTVDAWIWCGRTITWPPRSPDLTSLDFSVWGYVKDKVFVPLLPANLEELGARITEAAATVYADMIRRIWNEIAYRWDICPVTRENYIEHLWISVDKAYTYTAFCDIYHNTLKFSTPCVITP